MKRIGILTAGGDTPALNATIYGAVERANALKIELLGLQRGYAGLLDARVPHVHLNPLFTAIPELDPCKGGTLLGSSRTYLDETCGDKLELVAAHVKKLKLDGLICIGGDGNQRHATHRRDYPMRSCPENDRQRSGPELHR